MQPISAPDKFHDMELRAVNAAPCEIVTRAAPGETWPYGVMIFWKDDAGQVRATFGDLTIDVNAGEILRLIRLCRGEAWL